MSKLIGRKQELSLLNDIFDNQDAFVLLSGPSMIGKSKLIQDFLMGKNGMVFSASETTDDLNKTYFKNQLEHNYNFKNESIPGEPGWEDLFRIYASIEEPGRKVLVLDNLNYLIQNNKDFSRELINAWLKYLKLQNVLLIGIISNNSTLTNLETQKKSLLDSVSVRIKLQPINFVELLKEFPNKSFLELVSSYSIISGLPQYLPILINTKSVPEQLEYLIKFLLNTNSFYNYVPSNFIDRNVWNPIEYITILSYLAQGVNTVNALVEKTGFKAKDIETYLNNLIILGIIKISNPFNQKKEKSKRSKYVFANNGFRFWARYILPNQSLIEAGKNEKLLEIIQEDFDNFLEEPFTEISKDILQASANQGTFDFNVDKIGGFWNNNISVPVVAVDENNKKIFFGDTKALINDYSVEDFKNFIEKINNSKDFRKYRNYQKVFGLFTAGNIDEEFEDFATNNDDTVVFSGTTIFKK